MKALNLTIFILIIGCFMSCGSDATSSGDGSIGYESGDYLNIMTNYSPFTNGTALSRLYVENADPYRDIIGSTLNGNLEGSVIDFTISDLGPSFIYMYCRDNEILAQYMTDCKLIVNHQITNEETVLATLSSFNESTSELEFNINGGDYTTYLEDFFLKEMYFEFTYNDYPPDIIEVTYRVAFDCYYEYQTGD